MAKRAHAHGLFVFAAGFATAVGCSSKGAKDGDAGIVVPDGSADVGGDPGSARACRVAMDDPLNPCEPTVLEQETRYQGTDFGFENGCFAGIVFETVQAGERWQCVYWADGSLLAWDRVGHTPLCGGADAVVADRWSMGQVMSCLTTDAGGWSWILGFDPGPTTIAVTLGTATTGSTAAISIGIGFTLTGREIASSDLTLRYWYTADALGGNAPPQSISCDGFNGIPCDGSAIVSVSPPRPNADTYFEVSFPTFTGIISTGFDFGVAFSITRTDGALFDQSNDYSYNGQAGPVPTSKVTAYVKGALIYGTEP